MNGERTHAQAIVVTVIAVAVGLSLVIFTAAAAWTLVNKDLTLSASQTAVMSTAFGAMIGILGTYIGVGRGQQLAQSQQPSPETPATTPQASAGVPAQAGAESAQTVDVLGPKQSS